MQSGTSSAAVTSKAASKRVRFDLRLLLASISALLSSATRPIALSVCIFLLTFVKWFGIPSPFAAAMLLSQEERSSPFALLGLTVSLVLRLLWGIELDIWQYAGCVAIWFVKLRCNPKAGIETAALAGLAMMPRAIGAVISGGALDILLSFAAVPVSMLAAICMRWGLCSFTLIGAPFGTKERSGAMLLCLLLIGGLGYFRVLTINMGYIVAVLSTVAIAYAGGCAYGVAGGLLCGLALAFGGHDCRIALSLTLCGLCCGVPFISKRRWLCLPAALLANMLAFFVMPLVQPPLPHLAAAVGGALYLALPSRFLESIHALCTGVPSGARGMENIFIAQRISHMQDAVKTLAKALPEHPSATTNNAVELGSLLCSQCANRELCWGRSRMRTERMLNAMMELSKSGENIDEQNLPILAEHGCLRADAVPAMARDAMIHLQKQRAQATRAHFERELTLTHLAAMSGVLSELNVLAGAGSLNDLQAAHLITLAIDELRIPAKLCYARRIDGHLQVALETESVLPIQKPLETLLRFLATEEEMPLSISRMEKGRIELEEIPLYSAAVGMASLCAGQRADKDDPEVCGDACVAKRCEGGRLLMMLSDGMGHGEEAHRQSEKTLELLLLLLEAGYTRRQAITAVNGIMLSAQEDERFSTVDLADIDLWTGDVYSEKLGACASWIVRGNHMKKVDAHSLPLGIMEEASPTATQYRLHSGDILILMSDGVADVFRDDEHLQRALEESLYIQPQRMADALLRNALLAGDGTPRDDMTVMVALLMDRQRAEA